MPENSVNMRRLRNDNPQINRYYETIANRFHALSILTFASLIIFLLLMALIFRNYLTTDNFKYMLKDLDGGSASAENGAWEPVIYDSLTDADFTLFRGDLVVAGASRLSLYNSSGNRLFSDTRTVKFPVVVPSPKYMLVYDLGGTVFTLYNSFTSVFTDNTDYEIYGGDISAEGSFAIATEARDAKYVVTLYNKLFQSTAKIYKNKYVTGVAVSDDGNEAAIISVDIVANTVTGEVMIVESGADIAKATHSLPGAMPVKADYFADGSFAVICDTSIYFYNSLGEQTAYYTNPSGKLSKTAFTANGLAAVFSANIVGNENIVFLFDTEGNIIYNNTVSSRIDDVTAAEFDGKTVICMLTASTVERVDVVFDEQLGDYTSRRTTDIHGSGTSRVLIDGSENVIVCSAISAYQLFTETEAVD